MYNKGKLVHIVHFSVITNRKDDYHGSYQGNRRSCRGVLADQWKEYFYCDSLPADVLVRKGRKRTSSRSTNVNGEENIISNGSLISVNEGQCMIIVEQGKVVELCAEAGEFKYDSSTEPSIFEGGLGKGIIDSFKTVGKRFTFGGDTAKDQQSLTTSIPRKSPAISTAPPLPFLSESFTPPQPRYGNFDKSKRRIFV